MMTDMPVKVKESVACITLDKIIKKTKFDTTVIECLVFSSHDYLTVRECIKVIIDEIEDEQNTNFIGILEWSISKEICGKSFPFDISDEDKKKILDRFYQHPDIVKF